MSNAATLAPPAEIGEINKYDFRTDTQAVFKARKGLNAGIVAQISEMKHEPRWMRDFRLHALEVFQSKPMPNWGGAITLDFQDIYYYLKPTDHQGRSWDDVPQAIKETFEKLGIPEAERKFLSGVKAQFESEVVYGSLKKDLEQQISYYNSLSDDRLGNFDYLADQSGRRGGDKNTAEQFLMRIMQLEQQYKAVSGMPTETPGQIITQPVAPPIAPDSQKK